MRKTIVQTVDDIDGTAIAPETNPRVRFELDGISYELDLTAEHRQQLTDALAPYIEAGRRVPRTRARR